MTRIPLVCLALALSLAVTACGGPTRYVNKKANRGALKTVAVLPFENMTNDKLCSERLNKIFVTEVLNYGAFQVVEPGQVMRTVRSERLDPATVTADDIKRLGASLKAQALVLGSVLEFEERRSAGQGARVKLQFRLVETETATTIWSVTRTGGGVGVGKRMFGLEGDTATEIAEGLIRDEIARMSR